MTTSAAPSKRRAEIVAMADRGVTPREIAVRLRLQPQTIHHYLWLARRECETTARFKAGSPAEVGSSRAIISRELAERLRPAAHARGLTVPALAKSILARVADDGLIDAVLDDANGEAMDD